MIEKRVSRAADLAVRARVPLDLFRFLVLQESIDAYEDVLLPYWDFFRFDRTAQEWAFYVRINNLLTHRSDTTNLPRLLAELQSLGRIETDHAAALAGLLARVDPIRKAVKHIRDKAVAHQDEALSSPAIYAYAKVNVPGLIELSDVALEVANGLCAACGVPSHNFQAFPTERLIDLLEALRRVRQPSVFDGPAS